MDPIIFEDYTGIKTEVCHIDNDGKKHWLRGVILPDNKVLFAAMDVDRKKYFNISFDLTYGRLPWTDKKKDKESLEYFLKPENFDGNRLVMYFNQTKLMTLVSKLHG